MAEEHERRRAFEERLAELKRKMEAGLVTRAKTLRDAAARLLSGDESARKEIKHESHKLRGIAGSYGYQELTEMAGELEQRASLSPPPLLGQLANSLAQAAEDVGARSAAAQNEGKASTPAPAPARVSSAPSVRSVPSVPSVSSRSPRSRASLRPKVKAADGGALRVLAMDDDPTTLRLLRLTLRDIGGFDAVIVTSAKQALEEMRTREFDVVISDAMMPDMNGMEFAAAARQRGGWALRLPIVILSAATADELGWQGNLSEPIEWLRKPFMPSTLVKDVAKIVEKHRTKKRSVPAP